MQISRALLDEVVAHAREEAPKECCGLIASQDGRAVAVHRMRNVAINPKAAYYMDGQEQYRVEMGIYDAGLDLGAIYHSHPRTEPVPSQTDVNLGQHPDTVYIIVGLDGDEPQVRAWRIVDGTVSEAVLEVQDGTPAGG